MMQDQEEFHVFISYTCARTPTYYNWIYFILFYLDVVQYAIRAVLLDHRERDKEKKITDDYTHTYNDTESKLFLFSVFLFLHFYNLDKCS